MQYLSICSIFKFVYESLADSIPSAFLVLPQTSCLLQWVDFFLSCTRIDFQPKQTRFISLANRYRVSSEMLLKCAVVHLLESHSNIDQSCRNQLSQLCRSQNAAQPFLDFWSDSLVGRTFPMDHCGSRCVIVPHIQLVCFSHVNTDCFFMSVSCQLLSSMISAPPLFFSDLLFFQFQITALPVLTFPSFHCPHFIALPFCRHVSSSLYLSSFIFSCPSFPSFCSPQTFPVAGRGRGCEHGQEF